MTESSERVQLAGFARVKLKNKKLECVQWVPSDHILVGDQELADAWDWSVRSVQNWARHMRRARKMPLGELHDWFDKLPRGGRQGRQLAIPAGYAMRIYKHHILEMKVRQTPEPPPSQRAGKPAGRGRQPMATAFDERMLREARQERRRAAAEWGEVVVISEDQDDWKE